MNKEEASQQPWSQKQTNQESVPPEPQPPAPQPGKVPPNIPIPGEPTPSGGGVFKCKVCGKKFGSKEELDLHIKTDHELESK